MVFALPEGCDFAAINENAKPDIFDFLAMRGAPVVLVDLDTKSEEFILDCQCGYEDDEQLLTFMENDILVPLSKIIEEGVVMTTLSLVPKGQTYSFFVSRNVYVIDINWPFGDFITKGGQKIGELHYLNQDYRNLFKCLNKHYATIANRTNKVANKLSFA